jgi:hypothetical protein
MISWAIAGTLAKRITNHSMMLYHPTTIYCALHDLFVTAAAFAKTLVLQQRRQGRHSNEHGDSLRVTL